MISALKKLTSPQNRSDGQPSPPTTAGVKHDPSTNGIHAMPNALQKKFGRGVHYNMKLLLRGDRSSGKSALFNRLQGKPFFESYESTEEIQVAAIQWNHKATDDIVKVEVWDVVDKGKKRIKLEGLKIQDSQSSSVSLDASLDAEFVDVYKGAHGVVFLFDVTKQWTFDYITREIGKVPKNLPILILGNFIDQSHHRCISRDQALAFVESLEDSAIVRYSESSMRNGFGLRFLHKFLSLPYLTLQREALLRQVESNEREIEATRLELDLYFQSEESDYEAFSDGLNKKRRQQADKMAPAPTTDVVVGQRSSVQDKAVHEEVTKQPDLSSVLPVHRNIEASPKQGTKIEEKKNSHCHFAQSVDVEVHNEQGANPDGKTEVSENRAKTIGRVDTNVENFVPEANAIDFFLNDGTDQTDANGKFSNKEDSDEDDDAAGGNPMVTSIKEDIDLDELDSISRKVDYEEL